MALWGNNDEANNAPVWAVASGLGVSANGETLYQNTTVDAYVDGVAIGVFGVDAAEQANTATHANTGAHAGWVVRTEGTGGRAGRVLVETLVAMGSMTSDGSSGDDDVTLEDTAE